MSTFILTALGFGAPLIVGPCSGARHKAWAKKTQSGDSQVAEKEGPEDKRMVVLCTAPLASSQILRGLLLVGPARQNLVGSSPGSLCGLAETDSL